MRDGVKVVDDSARIREEMSPLFVFNKLQGRFSMKMEPHCIDLSCLIRDGRGRPESRKTSEVQRRELTSARPSRREVGGETKAVKVCEVSFCD